jgi:hypothetical protein
MARHCRADLHVHTPVCETSPHRLTRASTSRADAARRAIYLDFEGRPGSPPDLAGVLIEGRFRQVVLNAALASAAKAHHLKVFPLRSLVAELVTRCTKEDRLLVAFSEHELVVVRKYCGRDLRRVYRNARAVAKRWRNRKHAKRPLRDHTLKSFLDFIRYRRPAQVGTSSNNGVALSRCELAMRRTVRIAPNVNKLPLI